MVSAAPVTPSGGTCADTVAARLAQSETETDSVPSIARRFLPSHMQTVRKSL